MKGKKAGRCRMGNGESFRLFIEIVDTPKHVVLVHSLTLPYYCGLAD